MFGIFSNRKKNEITESTNTGKSTNLSSKEVAESAIKKLIEQSGFDIECLSIGIDGEELNPFSFYFRLGGIGLNISQYLYIDNELKSQIRDLQSDLYELYDNEFEKERENRKLDLINTTLFKQRHLGLQCGILTLACKPVRLSEDSVKSYYTDYERKYAPYIINLYDNQDDIVYSHVVKCIESEFVTLEGYRPLDIRFKLPIEEQDVPKIYALVSEILKVYNQYVTEDYNKNKDSEEYQHRHDFDPACL